MLHTHTHTHLLKLSIRDLWCRKHKLASLLGITGPTESGNGEEEMEGKGEEREGIGVEMEGK